MNGKVNLYGRARRLAIMRIVAIVILGVLVMVLLINFIFSGVNTQNVVSEYDKLKTYFLDRGFSCELLSNSGGKCLSDSNGTKTTFYRYENGFEYSVKTSGYSLYIVHRLNKEDKIEFVTTSKAFEGYRNQKYNCIYDKSVLSKVQRCESVNEFIELDVKSYLGVIEYAQIEITNAINSSDFSLDDLLIKYEWIKK